MVNEMFQDSHDHHHGSHHHVFDSSIISISKKLITGILLNIVYLLVELGVGFYIGSLALVVDAGHNFSDVSGLFLVLIAFGLMKIKTTKGNTFGFRKYSILVSVFNSLLLVFAVGMIMKESIDRFYSPHVFNGYIVSGVALLGVIVNFLTAFFFVKQKDDDINLSGAYLHMIADGLVSLGVVVGGILMNLTGYYWIDPAISIVVGIVILYSCWDLLIESIRLATDAIPKGLSIEMIKSKVLSVENVLDIHHIHIRAISTKENSLTAHVRFKSEIGLDKIEKAKKEIKHKLLHEKISHCTLEIEFADCKDGYC